MSIARCVKTSIKTKLPSENTTKFLEKYERDFEGGDYNHNAEDITKDIVECLNQYAVIVAENTQTNTETVINTENDFILWTKSSGRFVTKKKVSCTYKTIDANGNVSDIVREFTWEDFYVDRQETPMLELKIYDASSGGVIKSSVYKAVQRLYNFLENNIEISFSDRDAIVYKDKNCRVEINGIDISEYYSNRKATSMVLSCCPDYSSSVSIEVTVDGLY